MSIQSKLPVAFRRLAWCNLAAQSAEQIALAATPILAVLMLGADAGGTGLLQTAATLPYPLFAIAAGVLADRTSRGMLMAVAEALRAVALITILVLAVLGLLTLPLLAVLSFILDARQFRRGGEPWIAHRGDLLVGSARTQ